MCIPRSCLVPVAITCAMHAGIAHSQVSKGHQILINRGLQVQGMVTAGDAFSLTTYQNARYTSIDWLWDSNPSLMGTAPGFPWSRWASDETKVPPQGGEGPFMSQLVTLQLGDEWHLNDDATRTRAVTWFNAIRANFPNTILYMNNWGGQVTDAPLGDFTTRARPDMLCFDAYPWKSDYVSRVPISRPAANWYNDLRRYREHARSANIPFGAYVQTFHAVQDYDQTVYRDPSPSELRLNHFEALAFNAKVLIDFTYNTGASSLFVSGTGDGTATALLATKTDCNVRARNLGKALVRLKPITDVPFPDLHTTSMMFLRGRSASGSVNPIPVGFNADPQAPNDYTDWVFQRNDPYLTGWTVTNTGTKNSGQRGDVILSWFKPLDESFDGHDHTGEVYLMVVNGLTDPTGTAADCRQEIKLNFNFSTGLTGVDVLDPLTGNLQTQTLPVVSGARQLVLNLDGGDAALFKFSNGAPFVGFPLPGSIIAPGATWRYFDAGAAPAGWEQRTFNDAAWPAGPAQLGFGDDDESTTVNDNSARVTTYFRHAFNVASPAVWPQLKFHLLRDDAAVVYLNGAELFCSNLPAGAITATTSALDSVSGAEEGQWEEALVVRPPLVTGTNVLAVEVHQAGTASSDLSFDLEMRGVSHSRGDPLPAGAVWNYLDNGTDPGTAWLAPGFIPGGAWKAGAAQLGYGDGGEVTVVEDNATAGYVATDTDRYITTYFRRTFLVPRPGDIGAGAIRFLRDDGIVVHLNGAELFRDNMDPGAVTSATPASSGVGGADESLWHTRWLDAAKLVTGENTIAVEIHQAAPDSSDISFDLQVLTWPYESLPNVSLSLAPATATLTWSSWAGAWQPRLSPDLLTWTFAGGTPATNGQGNWQLTVPRGSTRQFFRLEPP